MLKSMSIHQRDSKGIVRSYFVISYLAFRGLIPIGVHILVLFQLLLIGSSTNYSNWEF